MAGSAVQDSSAGSAGMIRFATGTVTPRAADGHKDASPPRARPLKYSRWRAATLGSIYVLFGLHIAHWKLNGTTLAPLELNEVMYTLEAGVVTAGFLLMATLMLATAFVGRFFCSWACHIMALEDLCSWLLRKLRIRARPVRSRLLFVMPTLVLLYMFVWPQVVRIWEGRPRPELRILGDADGWASFVTTNYWRNLPDPWIAGLTFLVCGFAMVYVLGSRSFCLHACPYGAAFSLLDRAAPGRIKLTGDCKQCGICTGVCASQVRVHEEIARYGKVVDPNCMKDLDCVSACPQEAIHFGFTRPAGFLSMSRRARRRSYDFVLGEELTMACVFFATILVFRGLYDAVPFLMTLGLAAVAAYLSVLCLRLARRPDVRMIPFRLKRENRLTGSGRVFVGAMVVAATLFAHSAFIRYHEALGQRAFDAVSAALRTDPATVPARSRAAAIRHLSAARKWGLYHPLVRDQQLSSLLLKGSDPATAEPYLRRIAREDPGDLDSRLALAQLLFHAGRLDEAGAEARGALAAVGPGVEQLRTVAGGHALLGAIETARGALAEAIEAYGEAAALDPSDVATRMELGQRLGEAGRYREAAETFRQAVALEPGLVVAHHNLGASLQQAGDDAGAIEAYRGTLILDPDDAPTLLNLGLLLARGGDLPGAAEQLGHAVEVEPGMARAHFNLAAVEQGLGHAEQARLHYGRAADLDPAYADRVPGRRSE